MLQVEIALNLTNARILLPAGLPGYESANPAQHEAPSHVGVGACVILALPEVQLQFRLHDYYMGMSYIIGDTLKAQRRLEMSLNVDTITGSIEADCPEEHFFGNEESHSTKQSLVIDGRQNRRADPCLIAYNSCRG